MELKNVIPYQWVPREIKAKIERIGGIGQFMSEQCAPPWTAIITVLPGAALKPMISLLAFGLDDVARGLLRPRGLKGPRKLARKKRWFNKPTVPEIGEEIGKNLPGADTIKGRSYGRIEKFIWMADGIIQRALYYVMVFGVVSDTWYNSVLALRKQGYCSTLGQMYLDATGGGIRYQNEELPAVFDITLTGIKTARKVDFDGQYTFRLDERKPTQMVASIIAAIDADVTFSGYVIVQARGETTAWKTLTVEQFKFKTPNTEAIQHLTLNAQGNYRYWRLRVLVIEASRGLPNYISRVVGVEKLVMIQPKTWS